MEVNLTLSLTEYLQMRTGCFCGWDCENIKLLIKEMQ